MPLAPAAVGPPCGRLGGAQGAAPAAADGITSQVLEMATAVRRAPQQQ